MTQNMRIIAYAIDKTNIKYDTAFNNFINFFIGITSIILPLVGKPLRIAINDDPIL